MSTQQIKLSRDCSISYDETAGTGLIDFSGEEVDDDNVSDDSASYALSQLSQKSDRKWRIRDWQGPWPGQGSQGSTLVRAVLVAE
jgi:hypothetical protein